jgi:hypothetical protein
MIVKSGVWEKYKRCAAYYFTRNQALFFNKKLAFCIPIYKLVKIRSWLGKCLTRMRELRYIADFLGWMRHGLAAYLLI